MLLHIQTWTPSTDVDQFFNRVTQHCISHYGFALHFVSSNIRSTVLPSKNESSLIALYIGDCDSNH